MGGYYYTGQSGCDYVPLFSKAGLFSSFELAFLGVIPHVLFLTLYTGITFGGTQTHHGILGIDP